MSHAPTLSVADLHTHGGDGRLLIVTTGDGRAQALVGLIAKGAPCPVICLPAWDCLPFDRVGPSRAAMGRGMAAIRAMAQPGAMIVVGSADAVAQRLPPPFHAIRRLASGDAIDLAELQAELDRLGYVVETEADQPGDVAVGAGILDVVPADGVTPHRIRHADGWIAEIDRVDPESHRSRRVVAHLDLPPASELVFEQPADRPPGVEHRIPDLVSPLTSLFDCLGPVAVVLDEDAREAATAHLQLVEDSRATRIALARAKGGPLPAVGLYLEPAELDAALADATEAALPDAAPVAVSNARALPAPELRIGDAIVHLDRGVALLEGIEAVEDGSEDVLALRFAADRKELVRAEEIGRIWRFGTAEGAPLDKLDGSSWPARRDKAEAALQETAAKLIQLVHARDATPAPVLAAPARAVSRFNAGFRFPPTPDQEAAFAAIADDLARGRPMDRLLVGDVGYGKTEVALRAAAIAALAGKQVVVLAPTTVLVRQHLAEFRRRFDRIGIKVAGLSRLTSLSEAKKVKAGLADGSVRVVVGTQALGGKGIAFADLGLVVIDEEQRFGAQAKTSLARLREGAHVLTLSATPIPRTLGAALAGLTDLSTLTTPPVARRPVRTSVEPLDAAVLVAAVRREHSRGGQSFVVCPRIESLPEVAAMLERLAPELSVVQLHGQMKPDALDAAIVGFAEGHGDVLVATDIIEAGLDIPRANTIAVCRADLFGLAQLHQVRGRVGRGRRRGMAWLFTDETTPPTEAGAARLATLAAHDGLGDGFVVAAADLDQRGMGDLGGDTQSGHALVLGLDLATHRLRRAIAQARGEAVAPDWVPVLTLGLPTAIPVDWMHDPAARIALHAQLAHPYDVSALAEELVDRHGPLPDGVKSLLAVAELRATCLAHDVAKLDAGPAGAAATARDGTRTVLKQPSHSGEERLTVARALLVQLAPEMVREAA